MTTPAEKRGAALALAPIAFAIAGAGAGYVVHRLVGCPSGGCPITGNPWISTLYGLFVGLVLGLGLAPGRSFR